MVDLPQVIGAFFWSVSVSFGDIIKGGSRKLQKKSPHGIATVRTKGGPWKSLVGLCPHLSEPIALPLL